MNARKNKSTPEEDLQQNLRYFAAELDRSRKQTQMATRLMDDLIRYHHYFCGETEKSFARLHEELRKIYPDGNPDPVSFPCVCMCVK